MRVICRQECAYSVYVEIVCRLHMHLWHLSMINKREEQTNGLRPDNFSQFSRKTICGYLKDTKIPITQCSWPHCHLFEEKKCSYFFVLNFV